MTQEGKEVIRRRFMMCLGRAEALLTIVSEQDGTNPTYPDLLDIMDLQSGLEDESIHMGRKLEYFLNYDEVFIKEATFYEEISALGRDTEEMVSIALSLSGEFLKRLTDVDGIFQDSRTTCLQLASDIMTFVARGVDVNPAEAGDVADLKETLGRKFERLKGSWENLLQSALDYDESVVFGDIADLVEITEGTTEEALFGAEDLLKSLHDRELCEWVGVEETDSTPEAGSASDTESEEADNALSPQGEVDTEGPETTEDAFFRFAYDAADDAPEPVGHTTPQEATNAEAQGAPAPAIPCRVEEVTPHTNAESVTRLARADCDKIPVSDSERTTDAPGARHERDDPTLDKLEGLRRLEEVFW
jgi:hypothetical protein